ncbi:MAG: GNAT family N-acetyltransferase [Microvirga sp.]
MIRIIDIEDAPAVSHLIREAFATVAPVLDPPPSALRETDASVSEQIRRGGGVVWDDGAIRGCVLWRPENGGLYLGRLAVSPGYQGRGIATGLLSAAEAHARRAGIPVLRLAVRLALPGNRRLFAAHGFVDTALRAHDGYAVPTYAEAEKRLVAPTAPPPGTGTR